jgi:hypothetical protein
MSTERDTEDAEQFVRGPGRRRRRSATGPVFSAYASGPSSRECANCGAKPGEYCHHPDGSVSTIPCLQRLSERSQ